MDFSEFTLAASTATLADEALAREHADCVEFRMDLADAPLDALDAYDGDLPLLVTNRAEWEGGGAEDDDERLDALCDALAYDAVEAVDVELESVLDGDGRRVVDAAGDGTSVVVSVHDFEGTPLRQDMRGLLGNAVEHGDVGKLAVTATDRQDVLDLLAVTHEYDLHGERVATMAMGDAGRHSRAVTPVYGSKIGYASVRAADATAPGQYDVETLRELVDDLRSGTHD